VKWSPSASVNRNPGVRQPQLVARRSSIASITLPGRFTRTAYLNTSVRVIAAGELL
jgi:hypothetical protein